MDFSICMVLKKNPNCALKKYYIITYAFRVICLVSLICISIVTNIGPPLTIFPRRVHLWQKSRKMCAIEFQTTLIYYFICEISIQKYIPCTVLIIKSAIRNTSYDHRSYKVQAFKMCLKIKIKCKIKNISSRIQSYTYALLLERAHTFIMQLETRTKDVQRVSGAKKIELHFSRYNFCMYTER